MKNRDSAWRPPALLRPTPAGAVYLFISLWGCLSIYAVTGHLAPPRAFAARQIVWVGIGAGVLFLASARGAPFYRRSVRWLSLGSYLLLLAVLVYGIRVNGMRGWFAWKGIFFQPSEFAKPVFVLCLVRVMEHTARHRPEWIRGYLPCLLCVVAWLLPVALQPDFGALLIYGMGFVAIYWCLGGPIQHLLATALVAIPLLPIICLKHPYIQRRLAAFFDPASHAYTTGWHLVQFQRTLALGGWFGQPLSRGRWAQGYLPLGYSDSIFAGIAEATGFAGVLPIVVLIVALVAYGHYLACRSGSLFAAGVTVGIVTMMAGQALVHLSVNLGLMPATGITLPMISYGGSSLVSSLFALGIIEGVSRGEENALPRPDPRTANPARPVPGDRNTP